MTRLEEAYQLAMHKAVRAFNGGKPRPGDRTVQSAYDLDALTYLKEAASIAALATGAGGVAGVVPAVFRPPAPWDYRYGWSAACAQWLAAELDKPPKAEFVPMVLFPDGSAKEYEGGHSLEDLQECVGGLIEIVALGEGKILILDEEGRLKNKPYNQRATLMTLGKVYGDIRGVALLTHDDFMEDDDGTFEDI